jgi:hypothetical protein
MPVAPAIRADADALDVARAQCPAAVHEPPLDDRRMADELARIPQQRVHPAERVLPVHVDEVAFERVVQHVARGLQLGLRQLGGVRDLQLGHVVHPSMSCAVSSGTSSCGQCPTPSSSTQSACGSQSR